MKTTYTLRAKMLLSIVSAAFLALVVQPTLGFAATTCKLTFQCDASRGAIQWAPKSGGADIGPHIEYDGVSLDSGIYDIGVLTPIDLSGYTFAYWTADVKVGYCSLMREIEPGEAFSNEVMNSEVLIRTDTVFTAHFTRTAPYSITYTTDGNGSVSSESESVAEGKSPVGATPTPKAGYKFSHWTADVDVYTKDAQDEVTQFDPGDPISTDVLKTLVIEQDVTFTANFEKTSDVPDTPDDDSATPTNATTNTKVLPKTGDTLPSVAVASALGLGVVVVAGAAALRKRCN